MATAGAGFEPVQATSALLITPFQHFTSMIPSAPGKQRLEAGLKQSRHGTGTTRRMGLCSCGPVPSVSEPAHVASACPEPGPMVHGGGGSVGYGQGGLKTCGLLSCNHGLRGDPFSGAELRAAVPRKCGRLCQLGPDPEPGLAAQAGADVSLSVPKRSLNPGRNLFW